MNDLNYPEGQRIVTQGSSVPRETQFSLPNPGSTNMYNQVIDVGVKKVSYRFPDFITSNPGPSSFIWIKGTKVSLDSLDLTMSAGATVQRIIEADQEFSVYTPFVTSVNFVCALHGLVPITESDLNQIQLQPWFETVLKQYVKKYRAEKTINYSRIGDVDLLTPDRMVLLLDALEFMGRLPKIALGFVVHMPGSQPEVAHWPCFDPQSDITAWVLCEASSTENKYYGIGGTCARQQIDSDGEMEEDDEDAAPTPTPRKTAARILALQVPLAAGTSVDDIINHHSEQLHYNNMLKVALKLSNKEIAKRLGMEKGSGLVKRINVAIEFIESEFGIDQEAFRTAYDRERRANDIPARGKEEVSEETLDANKDKIAEAMAWIKTGGPRPAPTTAAASVATPGQAIAPPSGMGGVPFAGPYAATAAGPSTAPFDDPHAGRVSGPYDAPAAGPSASPIARGHATGFAAQGYTPTSSQDATPTFNDIHPGYAPASRIPNHIQNFTNGAHTSAPNNTYYGYHATSSAINNFQGAAPSHDQGSQMEVDGGSLKTNEHNTSMEGAGGHNWGQFMEE